MYTLDLSNMARFDLTAASQFVEFWGQFYAYDVKTVDTKERIDYFAELNIGSDLTEENVRRLLRWKYPRTMTDPKKKTGERNPTVVKVLSNLQMINKFRNGGISAEEMRLTAEQVFDSGIVFRVFLLHIAKPHAYPIGDQYVFRAYSLHTGRPEPKTWETYAEYSDYFGRIAQAMAIPRTVNNLRNLKRIDNALFAFGEFIKRYYDPAERSLEANLAGLGAYRDQDPGFQRAIDSFVEAEASIEDPLEGKPIEGEFVEGQLRPARPVQT